MRFAATGILLAAAASTALLGVHVAPASAEVTAPSCSYQNCTGQLPEEAGCDGDALTLESFWYAETLIELRYSPACEAAWARATGPGEFQGRCDGWTDNSLVRIEGQDWRGPGNATFDGCSGSDQAWSAMIGFDYNVRACYMAQQLVETGQSETSRGCTAWR